MSNLTDDPTAAAILEAVPCYPVPPIGNSPAIDALRAAKAGHGFIIGQDGVMLILRRPWLELDVPVSSPIAAHLPYGSVGPSKANLRCGRIPGGLLRRVLEHFEEALPNEAAAFVIWDEATGAFALDFPTIDEATPTRLVYRTPTLSAGSHVICDIHSHGRSGAFFSSTDNADDAHATKISMVFGRIDDPGGAVRASRLCAGGMFLPVLWSPFSGDKYAE
ncbi:PRTRC system protein A [Sphingobium sp. IP1]|uniref:PRTRC system protein A n=1 Tax=Sphingobium sp. IP1 TaxID=2021637 RepID=UPI000C074800|nr:PRTRC system protein A [Sphingobium sp. IP1]PHP18763.1 PRTRC system protein A [Sphingobium sp. IP1]